MSERKWCPRTEADITIETEAAVGANSQAVQQQQEKPGQNNQTQKPGQQFTAQQNNQQQPAQKAVELAPTKLTRRMLKEIEQLIEAVLTLLYKHSTKVFIFNYFINLEIFNERYIIE